MSRREARSTATAAGAATGDSSEDGSNNKRKRDDDNENDHQEDDDGSNNNNGDAKPEAVLSIDQKSDDEDDIDIDVPDGEFPSASKLGRILTLIEAVPVGKLDDESYNRMKMLDKWTSYNENNEHSEERVRCKVDFLMLGGLLRMIYLIERNMKDCRVVLAASSISANLMYFHNEMGDDTKTQMNAAATYAVRSGALRILLLASEEFIPSSKHKNWRTAQDIWRALLNICENATLELIDYSLLQPIVEANSIQYCLSDPARFTHPKVLVACRFAIVTKNALKAHPAQVPVFHQNRIMDTLHEFCKIHCSHLLSLPAQANGILRFCIVIQESGLLSPDDTKKWLPFVTTALSKHLTEKRIEKASYFFIHRAVDTISHRELDSTPLMDTLLSIIKSSDTPEELKPKYRALMTKILS